MKHLFAIILSLLVIITSCICGNAAITDVSDVGEKVVISDENWAYEKLNPYGWELDEYLGSATVVEMPWSFAKQYIIAVGDYAFGDNTTITSVTATSVIETIGDYAFSGCTSLEDVSLYSSTTQLGVGCFYGDSALTDINLEDTSIATVPAYCFAECGISELALPNTCTTIGNYAFYNCSDLSMIMIPDSVTSISENAFVGCDNLVIYASDGSYASEYAAAHGIDCVETISFLLGDADGDGDVSSIDATMMQRVLVDIYDDSDGMISLRGDVDENGYLEVIDVTFVQRWLVDIDIPVPVNTLVTRVAS